MYFPQATKGGGNCAAFPDVCKTPAPPAPFAPIPYPNVAQIRNATKTIAKVKVCNKDIVVEKSEPSSSNGDEPGVQKGMLKAPKLANEAKFLKGSSKVYATGKKCVMHLTPSSANGSNLPAGGVHIVPSQMSVLTHV